MPRHFFQTNAIKRSGLSFLWDAKEAILSTANVFTNGPLQSTNKASLPIVLCVENQFFRNTKTLSVVWSSVVQTCVKNQVVVAAVAEEG